MIHLHEHRYEYLEEVNEGIIKQIPANSSKEMLVLDVGCGTGALSEAIQSKGYRVWGIEENKQAAEKAKARIEKVLLADLTSLPAVKEQIGSQLFDVLVFSDVLEHVYDPFSILQEYLSFLKEGGLVLVSVPNAVVWSNRLKILFGSFNYSGSGVMDRTHIRFFTFKTARELVQAAGCSVIGVDYTPYLVRAFLPVIKRIFLKDKPAQETNRRQLIDSPLYKFYMKYFYPAEYWSGYFCKSLSAFRIIIAGRKEVS